MVIVCFFLFNSVAEQVRTFCRIARQRKTTNWILVLPMLHFLERDSKPFEPIKDSAGQDFDVWSGLEGLGNPHVTDSQHTRQLCLICLKKNVFLN